MNVLPPLKAEPTPPGDAAASAASMASESAIDIAGLFRDHNSALLRFAAAKLGSEQEARDVAQEAYVRLLQLDRPETISYLRAFLFKITSNLAMDRLRARRRAPPAQSVLDEELVTFDLSPERQCAGQEMVAIMNSALLELPAKCREIFVLHRVDGLSRAEIASRMGLGERMVRLYMARALEHVRRRLDEASTGRAETP
jgi:RNA polymerase sigma factor (sigma-70 family)